MGPVHHCGLSEKLPPLSILEPMCGVAFERAELTQNRLANGVASSMSENDKVRACAHVLRLSEITKNGYFLPSSCL